MKASKAIAQYAGFSIQTRKKKKKKMQTYIGEPVIPRDKNEDEKLLLEFLRIITNRNGFVGLKLDMHATYWTSQGIGEFTITARKTSANHVDFTIGKREGPIWDPEKDPVTVLEENDLDMLHKVILMLESWEYTTGFRTSNHEIFTQLSNRNLLVVFWPTKANDVDVSIVWHETNG